MRSHPSSTSRSAGLQFLCRSPQAVHIAEHALAWTELVLVVTEQENGGAWFQPLRTGGTVCVLASKQPERGGEGKGGGLQWRRHQGQPGQGEETRAWGAWGKGRGGQPLATTQSILHGSNTTHPSHPLVFVTRPEKKIHPSLRQGWSRSHLLLANLAHVKLAYISLCVWDRFESTKILELRLSRIGPTLHLSYSTRITTWFSSITLSLSFSLLPAFMLGAEIRPALLRNSKFHSVSPKVVFLILFASYICRLFADHLWIICRLFEDYLQIVCCSSRLVARGKYSDRHLLYVLLAVESNLGLAIHYFLCSVLSQLPEEASR